jgi:ethanolamine transporter EutH
MAEPFPGPRPRSLGKRVTAGLRRLALAAGLAAAIVALALGIALPLWYFSDRSSRGFTAFVVAALAALLLFFLVRRLLQASRQAGGFRSLARRRILPALRTVGLLAAGLAALYGIAWAVTRLFR